MEDKMIECINIRNNHQFLANPLASQHELRFKSIIVRQGWEVPSYENLEYDSYDNPAATYLVWRDYNKVVRGVSRLYPTDRPYMLQEVFSHLSNADLPNSKQIWEGSRFCVDESLPADIRQQIIKELVVSYLEFGLVNDIEAFIGLMYPAYWRNIFTKSGWDIEWLGSPEKLEDGKRVRAGKVHVSERALEKVRETTGIYQSITNLITDKNNRTKEAA